MKINMLRALAAGLWLMASTAASALALSDAEMVSRLNQPLDARIRLVALSQAELDSLTVKVQPAEGTSYSVAGLQQEIRQDENGHYLVISTREPVREPVLSITVEMNWSTGRMTRQYDLIIDPS